jgi:hypothetical protein
MQMKWSIARALLALLVVVGISRAVQVQPQVPLPSPQSDSSAEILPLTEPVDINRMTEQDWFMLNLRMPNGVTYAEAKRLLPALSELSATGQKNMFKESWLFTATVSSRIDGMRIEMNLSFWGGTDSTCTLDRAKSRMSFSDPAVAKLFYERMTECFSARFGQYKEDLTEGAYEKWTRNWYAGGLVRLWAALTVSGAKEARIDWEAGVAFHPTRRD